MAQIVVDLVVQEFTIGTGAPVPGDPLSGDDTGDPHQMLRLPRRQIGGQPDLGHVRLLGGHVHGQAGAAVTWYSRSNQEKSSDVSPSRSVSTRDT